MEKRHWSNNEKKEGKKNSIKPLILQYLALCTQTKTHYLNTQIAIGIGNNKDSTFNE